MNRKNTYGAEKRDEMKRKIIGMSSKQIQELSTQISIPFGTLTRWASEARHAVAKAQRYQNVKLIQKEDYARIEATGRSLDDIAKEARRTQIKELLINLIKEL